MSMQTDHFDSDETETVIAKVLCPTSYGTSIYVRVPTIGCDRRTDGGAKDMGIGGVTFDENIESYERGDYVYLTFEPMDYSDGHRLTYVERATFTAPTNVDEPTFPNTDIPKVCPKCGREAAALVQTEYNSTTGGKVNDNADMCTIEADNRGSWFDFTSEMSYVHGI